MADARRDGLLAQVQNRKQESSFGQEEGAEQARGSEENATREEKIARENCFEQEKKGCIRKISRARTQRHAIEQAPEKSEDVMLMTPHPEEMML